MAKVRTGLAKHGDAWFAMDQPKGKGQRGKTWVTEPGTNIILTLVLQHSALKLAKQFHFSAAVALAVSDFFSNYAGAATTIKWPNDIYWRDRKAGGILIENIVGGHTAVDSLEPGVGSQGHRETIKGIEDEAKGLTTHDSRLPTHWTWSVVGMGININQTSFPGQISNAVSLKQITGKEWDVIQLAKELCSHVQLRYQQLLAGDDLLNAYNQRLFKKGQTVKFKKGSRVFEAMVKEVSAQGELVVQAAVEERFGFGEVEWVL